MPDPADRTATTVTPNPDRGGVILHLPEITYLDTQVWSVDIGLTGAGLAALRAALAASTDRAAEGSVRTQLLDALDFSYCQGLGYSTPEELLAAYDRERATVQPICELPHETIAEEDACDRRRLTADRAAVLREAADAIQDVIDADRAYSPRRSNDRAALGAARQIVLGLIDRPRRMTDETQQPKGA